jgi:hypothetical protein
MVDDFQRARWQWRPIGWLTRVGTLDISADLWQEVLDKIAVRRPLRAEAGDG